MKKLEEIEWFHKVPLKDGGITPGQVDIATMEKPYLFDQLNFRGKSVLDIGCWDGYFSFMAEQRGAKRVVALDKLSFRWGGIDGFNFLHDHFKSSVEWKEGTVYQLPEEIFDIVLCYGVLYHLSDPLLAATNCFQRSKGLVAFEGLLHEDSNPFLMLLEPPFGNDPSNTYIMSTGYLEMIGRLNGFKLIKHHQAETSRGAMLFELQERKESPYAPTCFPIFPAGYKP